MNDGERALTPGVAFPSVDLCEISPTAFEGARKAVQLLGVTAEQAGMAFLAFGIAVKRLEEEDGPIAPRRPFLPDWWLK